MTLFTVQNAYVSLMQRTPVGDGVAQLVAGVRSGTDARTWIRAVPRFLIRIVAL